MSALTAPKVDAPSTTATTAPFGLMAEFRTPAEITEAAKRVHAAGYRYWDCHVPYPVHGLDKAMGIKRSILTYISFAGLVGGFTSALGLQYWTGAIDYRLNIGGKGFFDWQFSVPIDFELSILGTALLTVIGLFHLCRMPTWYNRYQHDESFMKATDDTFVVTIDSDDDRFSAEGTPEMLQRLGASHVHLVHATAE